MASQNIKNKHPIKPTQIILIGFLSIILCGTVLLMLPISSCSGEGTPFITAAFTSVSATCVTGLIIEDTAIYWNSFGQAVILCMIQIGGLGFMTMAVMLSILLKRRVTPREQIVIVQSLNLNDFDGVVPMVRRILTYTVTIELVGAILLSFRFIPLFGWGDGIWKSVFHAVSAFCNAGFDLMGHYGGAYTSLIAFNNDGYVCTVIMVLIIFGGIGFVVMDDILGLIRHKRRLSVYTKVILITTAILIFGGALVFFASEFSGAYSMEGMNIPERILNSFFASITARTAGFSTVDLAQMNDLSCFIMLILFFIGGTSGSTAGGVKVGTFAIIVCAIAGYARGKKEINVFKRKISDSNVMRAFTIVMIQFMLCVVASCFLMVCGAELMPAMLEAFSALGTVGSSAGLTPTLPAVAHVLLMFLMFFGRVGILTVTYAVMLKLSDSESSISYSEAQFLIG